MSLLGQNVIMADRMQQEKDRMDILHKFFQVARRDYLHAVAVRPLPEGERYQILDLGAGTGIWAMDMAEYVLFDIPALARYLNRKLTRIAGSTHNLG